MPEDWDESVTAEVAGVLAESRHAADAMLDLAHDLEVKLPGTAAAFRDGILRQSKVAIIVRATAVLDPAEARAAEALVLDRAGRLTPGALRAAIARAVMEVAPKKAKKRREVAAKFARVERWAEDSGNAALAGRELSPDEVLAVDQRIAGWAGELKKAGLEGDMDVLRARALLDLLLGLDSRPGRPARPRCREPGGRVRRADHPDGAAGHVTGLATGRVRSPGSGRSTVAGPRPGRRRRPQPEDDVVRDRDRRAGTRRRPRLRPARTQAPQETAAGPGSRDGPGFTFAPTAEPGTWRLRIPGAGRTCWSGFDPVTTKECDHRFQAKGHDPGGKLRHLTQVRHATCTGPWCRRPAAQCDFEHNTPYEAGGRTCLCNGGPKCRRDHRLKQDPRWTVDQLPDGTFRWTTPTGRQYTTEPTRYPI